MRVSYLAAISSVTETSMNNICTAPERPHHEIVHNEGGCVACQAQRANLFRKMKNYSEKVVKSCQIFVRYRCDQVSGIVNVPFVHSPPAKGRVNAVMSFPTV